MLFGTPLIDYTLPSSLSSCTGQKMWFLSFVLYVSFIYWLHYKTLQPERTIKTLIHEEKAENPPVKTFFMPSNCLCKIIPSVPKECKSCIKLLEFQIKATFACGTIYFLYLFLIKIHIYNITSDVKFSIIHFYIFSTLRKKI